MAYPMTHLYIAKKILDVYPVKIKNESHYFLGSLMPDSVEWRKEYNKKISHLCNDNAKWGFVTDYEKWSDNVLEYYKQNSKTNDGDFLFGYCAHILADINYSRKIWTPFRLKNENKASFNELNKTSHDEGYIVDLELYQKCTFREEIFTALQKSKCIDFMGLVYKDEMEKMKNNVLNIQYNNKPIVNSEDHKVINYNELLNYVENTIEYIMEKLINKRCVRRI